MYWLAICTSSFEKCLFSSIASLLISLFALSCLRFWVLYILLIYIFFIYIRIYSIYTHTYMYSLYILDTEYSIWCWLNIWRRFPPSLIPYINRYMYTCVFFVKFMYSGFPFRVGVLVINIIWRELILTKCSYKRWLHFLGLLAFWLGNEMIKSLCSFYAWPLNHLPAHMLSENSSMLQFP
jgi:hypothetical protein